MDFSSRSPPQIDLHLTKNRYLSFCLIRKILLENQNLGEDIMVICGQGSVNFKSLLRQNVPSLLQEHFDIITEIRNEDEAVFYIRVEEIIKIR